MAADLYLLETASRPTLRLYEWDRPWLSFGYGQKTDWYQGDLSTLRRPTGGRAVLHDGELTYCLVLPQAPHTALQANFEMLTDLWFQTFQRLGIPVSKSAGASSGNANPSCYQFSQRGELYLHGQKFLGSAQLRRGERLLQHGSIPRQVHPVRFSSVFGGATPPATVPGLTANQLAAAFPVPLDDRPWSVTERACIEESLCPA